MEGNKFPNASSIVINHNTFVALSLVYDSQGHELFPMNFYYPPKIPGTTGFPVSSEIKANLFVGFNRADSYFSENQRYRGLDFNEISRADLNSNYTMKAPLQSALSAAGQLSHVLGLGTSLRKLNTYGALD